MPTGGKGRAVIQCQSKNEWSLFYIHQAAASTNGKIPTLTLHGIVIQNCRQSTPLGDSIIMVENAYVKIVESQFTANGALLSHPWTANDTCKSVQMFIANSTFEFNQLAHPHRPGIGLSSCDLVHIIAENVTFHATPIQIDGTEDLSISFQAVTFDGRDSSGVALYLTLANNTNAIVLSNSAVRGHVHGKNSAIVIAVNHEAVKTPIVHMNNITFVNNRQAKTTGSALSVFARFRHAEPINVGLKLYDCNFIDNSAHNDAGAIYLENVRAVRINACLFANNTGVNGGAIYVRSGSDIVFTNTEFHGNRAEHPTAGNYMTLGGAMYISDAAVTVTNCSFVGNSAKFSAQALYVIRASHLVIQQSYFQGDSDYHASPHNAVVVIDSNSDSSNGMDTQLTNNVFNVTENSQCGSMVDVKANVAMNGNDFWCPHGHHVETQSIAAPYRASYLYSHAIYWCRACPPDTYSLQRGHLHDSTHDCGVCMRCPPKGYCEHGRITTRANHWGYVDKDYQLQFSVCPQGACCAEEHCDKFNTCASHRRGMLCESCTRHHSVEVGSRACVPESRCIRLTYTALYIVAFGVAYVLAFLALQSVGPSVSRQVQDMSSWLSSSMRLCCREHRQSESDGDDRVPMTDTDQSQDVLEDVLENVTEQSKTERTMLKQHIVNAESALKITFQFYQILPIVYQMGVVDGARHSVTQTLTDFFYLRPFFSVLHTACLPPRVGNSGVLLVYLLTTAMPVLVVCVAYLVGYASLCVLRCFRQTSDSHSYQVLKSTCFGVYLQLLLFTHVPLLTAGFGLLKCVNVADRHVLYVDASVDCLQIWQVALVAFIVVTPGFLWLMPAIGVPLLRAADIPTWQFLLATILPLPMLALWTLKLGPRLIKSRLTSPTYTTDQITPTHAWRIIDIMETPFRDGTSWQSMLLVHSLFIVAVSEFLPHVPVVRALVLAITCIVALAAHATWRPFVNASANCVGTVALCTLTVFSVFNVHRAVVYSMGQLPTDSNQVLADVYDWSYLAASLWLPVVVGVGLLLVVARRLVRMIAWVTRRCRGQPN